MTPEFAAHLAALRACRACPKVEGHPIVGAVEQARVMLVGQAPGPREALHERPFAYTAGKRMFGWFAQYLGITEADWRNSVHIGAVIRCFPGRDAKAGGDRVPDAFEIAQCGRHLDRELQLIRPGLVIAVGTLASTQLLGIAQLKDAVGVLHRLTRAGQTCDVVVLPHPSGRSTWLNKPENLALLERSMELIREHDAFRETFG
ncbi:MAG TPA: uracil-DNA glycosylase family protein [Thermoanaerobaculia bacterium]|jgi:uracil-DNA glycosylase